MARGSTWAENPLKFRGALRAPGDSFVLIQKRKTSKIPKRRGRFFPSAWGAGAGPWAVRAAFSAPPTLQAPLACQELPRGHPQSRAPNGHPPRAAPPRATSQGATQGAIPGASQPPPPKAPPRAYSSGAIPRIQEPTPGSILKPSIPPSWDTAHGITIEGPSQGGGPQAPPQRQGNGMLFSPCACDSVRAKAKRCHTHKGRSVHRFLATQCTKRFCLEKKIFKA